MNFPVRILLSLSVSTTLSAQTSFNGTRINFSGYPFTDGSISGTTGFNVVDDANGAKLTADNGDLDDIIISVSSSLPTGPVGTFANAEIEAGSGLRSNHGYNIDFASTYPNGTSNNPGNVVSQTFRVTFGNHLSITDFETDFTSMNTRGRTWEHSQFALLDVNGDYFSPAPALGDYLGWQADSASITWIDIGSEGPGNGASGSPSLGWFVAASTATVVDVGTNLSDQGQNGSRENFTNTNGDGVFNYADVGLLADTRIGGYEWTTFVEDTRGQNNNRSAWTTTQRYIDFSGTTVVPEPSAAMLTVLGSLLILRRKR